MFRGSLPGMCYHEHTIVCRLTSRHSAIQPQHTHVTTAVRHDHTCAQYDVVTRLARQSKCRASYLMTAAHGWRAYPRQLSSAARANEGAYVRS